MEEETSKENIHISNANQSDYNQENCNHDQTNRDVERKNKDDESINREESISTEKWPQSLNGNEDAEDDDVFDQTVFVSSIVNLRSTINEHEHVNEQDQNQESEACRNEEISIVPINEQEITVQDDGTLVLMTPLVPIGTTTVLPPFFGPPSFHPPQMALNGDSAFGGTFSQVAPPSGRNILEESVREVFYDDGICSPTSTRYQDQYNAHVDYNDDYRNDPNYDPADEEEDEYDSIGRKKRPRRTCVQYQTHSYGSRYEDKKISDVGKKSRRKGSKRDTQIDHSPTRGLSDSQDSASLNSNSNEGSISNNKVSPFDDSIKIPLPGQLGFHLPFIEGIGCVRKRNERERARVRNVNDGFERLRAHLPPEWVGSERDRRLSKVDTLRSAINYIHHLQAILDED